MNIKTSELTGVSFEIALARLMTLRSMLKLEMKGMARRGRSAYAIIKAELDLKGTRQRVLDQLTDIIEKQKEKL